jgi:ABC-type nitrate/sulfonate/bicarbonate transport system substrate-binding protein
MDSTATLRERGAGPHLAQRRQAAPPWTASKLVCYRRLQKILGEAEMKLPILLAVLAAVAASPAPAAEPVTIKMNWTVLPANLAPLIPLAPKEIYRHLGKSYVLQPERMRGSGAALTALAADQIQLSTSSPQSLVNAVTRAKIDIVAIGQELTTDMPGWASSGTFWVRKGEIDKVEDLKGKIVGVNSYGSSIDGVMRAMLNKHGLKPRVDYQIVEVRLPTQLAALKSKRIDLAFLLLPFNYSAEKDPGLKLLFTMGEVVGPAETVIITGKRGWLEKNRAVVVDFLEDELRLRRWLYDPKTRMKGIAIMSKLTKIPVKSYADWAFTRKDNYRDPNARIDVARLQRNVDFLETSGVVPKSIDVKAHVDLSYAKEAAARLKN